MTKKSHPSNREWTKPSLPPASPHRAGHYSGLHPEDQPYQSSLIAIQRPVSEDDENWHSPQHEPEHIVLPMVDPESDPGINRQNSLSDFSVPDLPVAVPPYMPGKRLLPARAIPVLLIISCIFFLLASSILAFVLIGRSSSPTLPGVKASPSLLRTNDTFTLTGNGFGAHSLVSFTYDINKTLLDGSKHPLLMHANAKGAFAVQIQIPADWETGQHFIHATDEAEKLSVSATITVRQPPVAPPVLQLSTSSLNFDADAPGVVSDKTISLINAGGGQITWQQNSDQSWLSVSPGNGTFSGSESVRITINRGTLDPQSYSGHITFTLKDDTITSSLILTVTMAVKAATPATPAILTTPTNPTTISATTLVVSPPSLVFSVTAGQRSMYKAIILQNSGNQSLYWTASATTADQGNWLYADPGSGSLAAGVEGFMNARVDATGLKPGSYQGILTFDVGGATRSVAISLTVS